jgi:hypothetical protein
MTYAAILAHWQQDTSIKCFVADESKWAVAAMDAASLLTQHTEATAAGGDLSRRASECRGGGLGRQLRMGPVRQVLKHGSSAHQFASRCSNSD